MTELGFTQSFTLIDIKLALGYATVAIAAFLYYIDKKWGFNESFNVTVASIIVYGVISLALFLLTNVPGYKNNKFVGTNESKQKLSVATWTTKYDPVYHVDLTLDDEKVATSIDFTQLFDAFGYYKQEKLTAFLQTELSKLTKKNE